GQRDEHGVIDNEVVMNDAHRLYSAGFLLTIAFDAVGDIKAPAPALFVARSPVKAKVYPSSSFSSPLPVHLMSLRTSEGKLGTEESAFVQFLATRSFQHLKQLQQEYVKITERELEDAVASEFSRNIEKGLTAISLSRLPRRFLFEEEAEELLFETTYHSESVLSLRVCIVRTIEV
ncbi:hypothetical protein QYM36_007928, partial [Artemia franciscana]